MECMFCRLPEFQFDYLKQQVREVKYHPDATEIICSNCVQIIFSLTKERLQEFQELNKKKEKAKAVSYIQEMLNTEEEDVPGKRPSRPRLSKRGRDNKTLRNFRGKPRKTNKR